MARATVAILFGGLDQPWHHAFLERLGARYEVETRYAKGNWETTFTT